MTVIKGACPHDCPDTCAWDVSVENGVARGLRGDPDHPLTKGTLCSKLKRYRNRVYSPERLLHPLRRVGAKGSGEFERVSWSTAIEEISGRLRDVIANAGPLSVLPCSFAGTIGLLQRYAGFHFFAHLGATNLDRDICGNLAFAGVAATLGWDDPMMPEDLAHSRFIIIWGTNTVATNLHLWSSVIRGAKANGATIVVIDPVATETARSADWHIRLKPGTDDALALGLMHVIVRDDLHDRDFIDQHTVGFAALSERLVDYPPARVAEISGVPARDIERLARAYATTRPAAIRLSVGMERHHNGGMMNRAVACLPGLIGAFRARGDGLCHFTAKLFLDTLNYDAVLPAAATPATRTLRLSQLGRALTDPNLDPPITWLMVYNANPLVSAPNQNLVRAGLSRPDLFTVVHEQFMTDTAVYADYVLPATTQFEHLELMPSWGHPYIALNQAAIEPLGEARSNTEVFRELARAMHFDDEKLMRSDEQIVRDLLASDSPNLKGITYERLLEQGWAKLAIPEPWRPAVGGHFDTASGKVEFYSKTFAEMGLDPLPSHVPSATETDAPEYPLALISAKAAHFLNSCYVNLGYEGIADHRPKLQIHRRDARARGIADGERVQVFNRFGCVEVDAAISDGIQPEVVSLPFNWWPRCTANGSSANALTPDGIGDLGIGNDAFDARVQVARIPELNDR